MPWRGSVGKYVPPKNGLPSGVRNTRHRPAALAGHRLDRVHVDRVQVRPLLAVHLDGHEPAVELRRGRLVLERLALHHVAPVARRVADRQEDRAVLPPARARAPRGPTGTSRPGCARAGAGRGWSRPPGGWRDGSGRRQRTCPNGRRSPRGPRATRQRARTRRRRTRACAPGRFLPSSPRSASTTHAGHAPPTHPPSRDPGGAAPAPGRADRLAGDGRRPAAPTDRPMPDPRPPRPPSRSRSRSPRSPSRGIRLSPRRPGSSAVPDRRRQSSAVTLDRTDAADGDTRHRPPSASPTPAPTR